MKKRDRMQVILDFLNFVRRSGERGIRISVLCQKINVSYIMCVEYSGLFIKNGLIKRENGMFLITEKGNEFLTFVANTKLKIEGYLK